MCISRAVVLWVVGTAQAPVEPLESPVMDSGSLRSSVVQLEAVALGGGSWGDSEEPDR